MVGDPQRRTSGLSGGLATVIGAVTAGKREPDRLIKTILSAGFAGAMCLYLLHAWNQDRSAERAQRHQEHVEMVQLLRDQHQEDISERRLATCINAQMTTTVRAAIWRERPQPLAACSETKP
jgi:hypothetical protein